MKSDNGGSTIAYGHDLDEGEDFSDGLSEEEGLELALCDLDKKYEVIIRCIGGINDFTETDINVKQGDYERNERQKWNSWRISDRWIRLMKE